MTANPDSLSRSRRRGRVALAFGASAVLVLAGCSGGQEGTSTSTAGAASNCANAEQAQTDYAAAWTSTAKALGLKNFSQVTEQVCQVDASKWKKDPKQGSTYRIAFAAQGPTNSWAKLSEEAFKYHAKQLGVDELYASANGDATTQVDNIQQLTSQNPDAMVVVPMGEGVSGQVKAAVDQKIPVVLCSGILSASSGAISTVTRQYDLLGSAYAEWLGEKLGGKGQIALLSGLAGVPTAEYQLAAAKKVFADKFPGIKIVTQQYTKWSPTVAKTVAQNLIATYPHLAGIWSDSGYGAMGVVQAYTEAGLAVPPITGDTINDFLLSTQGKHVDYALSTFPPEMSMKCLDTAMSLLKGENVLNKVYLDTPSFTSSEASKYVRKDCNGSLYVPSDLPDSLLVSLGFCTAT